MGGTSAKVRATKSRWNFLQRMHPMVRNAPKYEFRFQWGRYGAFVAKCSCHEVVSEFFTTNAPDPSHWTLNSCFGVFHTILVHLGPFGYFTNLEAKQSRVGIFHNERARSTSLDPKLMFCCVSNYLGAFGIVWLPYETRCKKTRCKMG